MPGPNRAERPQPARPSLVYARAVRSSDVCAVRRPQPGSAHSRHGRGRAPATSAPCVSRNRAASAAGMAGAARSPAEAPAPGAAEEPDNQTNAGRDRLSLPFTGGRRSTQCPLQVTYFQSKIQTKPTKATQEHRPTFLLFICIRQILRTFGSRCHHRDTESNTVSVRAMAAFSRQLLGDIMFMSDRNLHPLFSPWPSLAQWRARANNVLKHSGNEIREK